MNFDIDTDQGMANSMAWTQNIINMLKPGGAWAIPRSNTLVTFDRHRTVATMIVDKPGLEDCTKRVLQAIGWAVEVQVRQ